MWITLSRHEKIHCEKLAIKLCEAHNKEKTIDFVKTYSGLMAEFAVIKFFNYTLNADPKIEFNTTFINGGDGGIDFNFGGLTWNVKSTSENYFETNHLLQGTHQIVFGVRSEKEKGFLLLGFIPVSRLARDKIISTSEFAMPMLIRTGFRKYLSDHKRRYDPNALSEFEQVGSTMALVASKLKRNLDPIDEIGKS